MSTIVTVEMDPEYVKWPSACACCNRLDERDMEVAVPSTSPEESDQIMECRIPYCLECYAHVEKRIPWWKGVALFVVLSFAVSVMPAASMRLLPLAFGIEALTLALYVGWTIYSVRRSMKPSCAGMNRVVQFVHPTTSEMTTVLFKNDYYALRFKDLNRFSVVEE